MASFFRGVRSSSIGRGRDTVLKESLTNNLSECVKAIQFDHQTEEYHHQVVGSSDVSNALCFALEAIFLHGLKDTFFKKAKNVFSADVDQKPDPSFWPLILVLSHRDNIENIASLQQITTETGQCRAWLRIALNDCLLSSYISTILRNMNTTKAFYSHSAFIRDAELLDVAQRFLEGVESCTQFDLPVNSSLHNSWPNEVLMLAGLWMPTMRNCPVAPGVDVASLLSAEAPEPPKPQPRTWGSNLHGLGHIIAMDHDEAFNFIIARESKDEAAVNANIEKLESTQLQQDNLEPVEQRPETTLEDSVEASGSQEEEVEEEELQYDESAPRPEVTGNSLSGKTGWSSDGNDELKTSIISNSNSSTDSSTKNPDSKSLTSSIEVSGSPGGSYVKTPNLREVMRGLHKELILTNDDRVAETSTVPDVAPDVAPDVSIDDPVLTGLGFEVVSGEPSALFDPPEMKKMISQVGTLSREQGLDRQDYQCIGCHDVFGSTVSKAKVCAYTGKYYCSKCMDPNVFMIPARVIQNWDFSRYPVSKRAGLFMLEFQHHPLIDIKIMNPLIYTAVKEMALLKSLRTRLKFLSAYLFMCREPVIEELQKRVWPREYLYEQEHLYSISDLAQISNGSLASQLQKVVTFAQNHVKDCWLCSQKGFICEVCHDPKVLYPFDIENTFRCEECSSVFHFKCLNAIKPCPKCERRKKRQGLSLVDAVHTNYTSKS